MNYNMKVSSMTPSSDGKLTGVVFTCADNVMSYPSMTIHL